MLPEKISFRPGLLAGPMSRKLKATGETPSEYLRQLVKQDLNMLDLKQQEQLEQAEDAVLYALLGSLEAARCRLWGALLELRIACGVHPGECNDWRKSQPQMQLGRDAFDALLAELTDYPTCWDEQQVAQMPDEVRRRVQERLEKIINGGSKRREQ